MNEHPPRPKLALAVGVIGHRPNRLPGDKAKLSALEAEVDRILGLLATHVAQEREHYRSQPVDIFEGEPVLSVVSALAEGTDRIVADAALRRGFYLDVPLPFPRSEYEKDFIHRPASEKQTDAGAIAEAERQTKESLAEFSRLVTHEKTRAVLELPGKRTPGLKSDEHDPEAERAYEAAGLTILSQADVVLTIWDGKISQGRGGTPELLAEAARIGLPIIVVDANAARRSELRWSDLAEIPAPIVALDDLPRHPIDRSMRRLVDELVRLPVSSEQRSGFYRWLEERFYSWNFRIGYPLLMRLLWARSTKWCNVGRDIRSDIRPKSPDTLANELAKFAAPVLSTRVNDPVLNPLAAPYGWADAIGIWCGQLFRGAFVLNFLFAAVAVVIAAASLMAGDAFSRGPALFQKLEPNAALVGAEILLIACVLLNTWIGRRRQWHRRWVETREIAERFRVALPLWALGLRSAAFVGQEPTWTGWYVRAFVRMQGLRGGSLVGDGLSAARSVLLAVLLDQCGYNDGNAKRMHKMERRLEWVGLGLFIATLLVAIDHVAHSPVLGCLLGRITNQVPAHTMAIWLSAALPALATATYGIRVIGDFEGIMHRSEHTRASLEQLVLAVKQETDDLAILRLRARTSAEAMLGDVESWRLSAESRGLAIPG